MDPVTYGGLFKKIKTAITISTEHIFDNASTRDNYYTANTSEKKDNSYCVAGGKIYRYTVNGWAETTPIFQGVKGDVGNTPQITIGTVVSGETMNVTTSGTNNTPILNFTLPKGDKGDTGLTGASGITWKGEYVNTETYNNNFAVRAVDGELGGTFFCTQDNVTGINSILLDGNGDPILDSKGNLKANTPTWDILSLYGVSGKDGKSATITVGNVETLEAGNSAIITNVGDTNNATFDFKIPKGNKGDIGKGIIWTKVYNPSTLYKEADACYWNSCAWICILNDTQGVEPSLANTTNWDLLCKSGDVFIGSTDSTNGKEGLVPAPQVADKDKILTGTGWEDVVTDILNKIYPVGHIMMTENSANPSTYLGVGTWVAYGGGRVPVGIDTSITDFSTVGQIGGAKEHTLTSNQMPKHNHPYQSRGDVQYTLDGWGTQQSSADEVIHNYTTGDAGGNQPHNNLQPYIVCYMWKRTV